MKKTATKSHYRWSHHEEYKVKDINKSCNPATPNPSIKKSAAAAISLAGLTIVMMAPAPTSAPAPIVSTSGTSASAPANGTAYNTSVVDPDTNDASLEGSSQPKSDDESEVHFFPMYI
jgi:hypothetical protein